MTRSIAIWLDTVSVRQRLLDHLLEQVGQNLQDHFALFTMNFSKPPMTKEDYGDGTPHGVTYCSCPLAGASSSDDTSASTRKPSTSSPSTSASTSSVVGLLYLDGGTTAKDMPYVLNMLLNKPGFLATIVRISMVMLSRIAVFLLPVDRFLRGSRGAGLFVTTIKSRGTVRLASADAKAHPLIDPAYLTHPQDKQAICACWHKFRKAKTETPTGKAVFGDEIVPGSR